MSRTRLPKAPYDRHGSLMSYVGTVEPPFPDMLLLTGTKRGMSAARFTWSASGARTFEMFMTDAADFITNATNLFKGSADTWWIAQKRGKNYGIRLATQDDLQHAGHI
ncbi:hypothetical protein, partial [Streptomyces sp. NPDC056670]|uniref:hypothetical protein n=1 Tax=Streptomyces sp. NPDC056670 TaxID=3345904 RepID=UPI0036A49630